MNNVACNIPPRAITTEGLYEKCWLKDASWKSYRKAGSKKTTTATPFHFATTLCSSGEIALEPSVTLRRRLITTANSLLGISLGHQIVGPSTLEDELVRWTADQLAFVAETTTGISRPRFLKSCSRRLGPRFAELVALPVELRPESVSFEARWSIYEPSLYPSATRSVGRGRRCGNSTVGSVPDNTPGYHNTSRFNSASIALSNEATRSHPKMRSRRWTAARANRDIVRANQQCVERREALLQRVHQAELPTHQTEGRTAQPGAYLCTVRFRGVQDTEQKQDSSWLQAGWIPPEVPLRPTALASVESRVNSRYVDNHNRCMLQRSPTTFAHNYPPLLHSGSGRRRRSSQQATRQGAVVAPGTQLPPLDENRGEETAVVLTSKSWVSPRRTSSKLESSERLAARGCSPTVNSDCAQLSPKPNLVEARTAGYEITTKCHTWDLGQGVVRRSSEALGACGGARCPTTKRRVGWLLEPYVASVTTSTDCRTLIADKAGRDRDMLEWRLSWLARCRTDNAERSSEDGGGPSVSKFLNSTSRSTEHSAGDGNTWSSNSSIGSDVDSGGSWGLSGGLLLATQPSELLPPLDENLDDDCEGNTPDVAATRISANSPLSQHC